MSSYYERVIENLASAKIARSEDIHLIQSNIQHAFMEMLKDVFGDCILDDDEDALKLIPTADHVDQSNKNYDEENDGISFYDTYLRQKITIEKSEIQSIRVQMMNESNISPTIFAEIRDMDMNLKKETNIILKPTTKEDTSVNDFVNVDFIFNLQHLPVGDYYFIIRPVDLSAIDMALNGDEYYGSPNASMFKVRYDIDGNYNEGLDASYNGTDYLPSNILPNVYDVEGMTEGRENNFDLYFEHIYSTGNTYTITPAGCLVMGQKTYPVDTHVTIDGPSKQGDRTDLVSLTDDGLLNVLKGTPYTGEKIYPVETTGLKIAYITTYQNSAETWTCPACGTVNNGNLSNCHVCDTTTNNRIPLIEQNDESNITRQRDVLERLRRLEKKLDYQIQNNIPSRIKYTCPVDPTMAISAKKVQQGTDSQNNPIYRYVYPEDSYGLSTKTNSDGSTILTFDDNIQHTYSWSIINKVTTTKSKTVKTSATITGTDVNMPTKKPSKVKNNQLYTLKITKKMVTTTSKVKENSNKTSTQSYYTTTAGIKGLKVTFYIKKDGKVTKTIKNKTTNSKGEIQLNLWDYIKKKGSYTIVAKYDETKISNKITVKDKETLKVTQGKSTPITITESTTPTTSTNVKDTTFTGNDSFYTENITVDSDKGEVFISKNQTSKKEYKNISNIPKKNNLKTSNKTFTIQSSTTSQQSEYGMMNFQVDKDIWINSITPGITNFSNIKAIKIVLFKNNKVFDLNSSRTSYIKYTDTKKAKNTNFPNVYESKWISLSKLSTKKNEKKQETVNKKKIEYRRITLNEPYTFKTGEIELKAGTYSLLVLGKLDKTKVDGKIIVKQYHANDVGKYGAVSSVKGTYNPQKVFLEKHKLTNRTWELKINQCSQKLSNHEGTIVSKTVDTGDSIKQCAIESNFDIPAGSGTDVEVFVSNNGGKTYIPIRIDSSFIKEQNDKEVKNNIATFNGLGHEFKWKIIFHGNNDNGVSPKLKYSSKMKTAIKFTLTVAQSYIGYEDYGRCFSTPLLNANAITRTLAQNNNITNKFEEWEFCRLWMEDDLNSTMDICFSYDNNDYTTNVNTTQENWGKGIFFSQVLSNLNIQDFSQNSIDYSNYNADVEYDENNFRFKYDPNMYNMGETIIATPLAFKTPETYDYNYGDITDENIDMSSFDYGLQDVSTIYKDNHDDSTQMYSGSHLITGPYFQAMYNPSVQKTGEDPTCWSNDSLGSNYNSDACIIGVSFNNGLEIKDEYTSLNIDIFPNLRDCQEEPNTTTGELKYDSTTGLPIQISELTDTTKYIDQDNYYYIPANTLEIVVSLNPYGLIEDDNATYGKAYPITVPLRSCKHTPVSINLSDLYGSTIYSIGIRVNTAKDDDGNFLVGWKTDEDDERKNPSLHAGDILGIGNISFDSYNIKPYLPYIYTGNSSRWNWNALRSTQNSIAYIIYQSKDANNANLYYSYMPITKNGNAQGDYIAFGYDLYEKNKTTFIYKDYNETNVQVKRQENTNRIQIYEGDDNTTPIRTSTDLANSILFMLNSMDGTGSLFRINTDIDTTAYDWINIKYNLEIVQSGQDITFKNNDNKIIKKKDDGYKSDMELMKGEVIFDLYDTRDIIGATPIESLPLPAWGKIQERYGQNEWENGEQIVDKTVNAWFKLHTNATIKTIVLRRENPTNRLIENLSIVLQDIVFLNTSSVPALGPQMQVRIYPENMDSLLNTKIRKFGCVYRLG